MDYVADSRALSRIPCSSYNYTSIKIPVAVAVNLWKTAAIPPTKQRPLHGLRKRLERTDLVGIKRAGAIDNCYFGVRNGGASRESYHVILMRNTRRSRSPSPQRSASTSAGGKQREQQKPLAGLADVLRLIRESATDAGLDTITRRGINAEVEGARRKRIAKAGSSRRR